MDHQRMLDALVRWARADDNVRVLALEGSVARDDGSVDQWSDLDIRCYVDDPSVLLDRNEWYEQFGDVLAVEALPNPGWYPTRLVIYVDAKIDFMIAPVAALHGRTRFGRRVRVLVDKDGVTAGIESGDVPQVTTPDASSYGRCTNEFYSAAVMAARMLARDEPVKAKFRDWDMKRQLFTMLEWDAVVRGTVVGVRGAGFRSWAEPADVAALEACWSGLGRAEGERALDASVTLFRRVSEQVATALGFTPFAADPVLAEIARIRAG